MDASTSLNRLAFSATAHCPDGLRDRRGARHGDRNRAGPVDLATIALAVAVAPAFLFGYSLTMVPLLRSGLALAAVIPLALAADTMSIAVMEVVDNAVMLLVPGAMEAGLANMLFWGSLAAALSVAFVVAFPVNRLLIARRQGHAEWCTPTTDMHTDPLPVRRRARLDSLP